MIQFDKHIFYWAWFNHQLDKRLVPYSGDLDAPKAWSAAWSFRSGFASSSHGGCCGCRGIGIWKTLGWIPWEIGVAHQMLKKTRWDGIYIKC